MRVTAGRANLVRPSFVMIVGGGSMAGLEHEMTAGGGHGRLRASHADRERVIDTLKAAYAYGLVTKDELEARVSQMFAARTYAELAVITADIPAGLAPAPPPLRPVPAKASAPVAANVTAGTARSWRPRLSRAWP
jgi:hypothetical protein